MIQAPVIYNNLDIPVSSLNVHLEGSGSSETSGFIYQPTGGIFSSGSISNGFYWNYEFVLMSENQEFSIQSFDVSGNLSPISKINIEYEIKPPLILSPGNPRILSINESSTGSSNTKFQTLIGNFLEEGVIVGDYVLGISGRNQNQLNKVREVSETYLITDPFNFFWKMGDQIKIYPNNQRPVYKTNKLAYEAKGLVDSSAEKVLYTTSENFDLIKIYAGIEEDYSITNENKFFSLKIDGITKNFDLDLGIKTASEIAFKINQEFNKPVAFVELVNLDSSAVFFIQGKKIEVFETPASIYFKMCKGDFNLAKNIPISGSVVNLGKCEVVLNTEDTARNLNLNIDGNILQYTIPLGQTTTPSSIALALNTQAGKCVASPGPNSITLIASDNLDVLNDVGFLNLDQSKSGVADLNNGEWSLNLEVPANLFTVSLVAQDKFGNTSEINSLDNEYQISTPVLLNPFEEIDCVGVLPVEEEIVNIFGEYDSEGSGVQINGLNVNSLDGNWSIDLDNLQEGKNVFSIVTIDKFGTPSIPRDIAVDYKNPFNQPALEEEEENLRWTLEAGVTGTGPEKIKKYAEKIKSLFSPYLSAIKIIKTFLQQARSLIKSKVLGNINQLVKSVQNFINEAVGFLNDFSRGAGIYLISTIPKPSEVQDPKKFLDRLRTGGSREGNLISGTTGAFDGFIDSLVSSFDDTLDPYRPQFSSAVKTGAYCLAIADNGDGLANFIQSLNQMSLIVNQQLINAALSAPINVRVSNENKRVVLTWSSSGSGIKPGIYTVWRSENPGGKNNIKKIKNTVFKKNSSKFFEEKDIDPNTGQPYVEYQYLGKIDFNSIDTTKYVSNLKNQSALKLLYKAPLETLSASNDFLNSYTSNFRFIDGKVTPEETRNNKLTEAVLAGQESISTFLGDTFSDFDYRVSVSSRGTTIGSLSYRDLTVGSVNFLNRIRDSILYRTSSTEVDLINGKIYYYKIIPFFKGENVPSKFSFREVSKIQNRSTCVEVIGCPQNPILEFIQEDLTYQFDFPENKDDKGLVYVLQGSIYNNRTGLIAGYFDDALTVKVDGGIVKPSKILFDKGVVYLDPSNKPTTSIVFSYWGKKEINTTRAKIIGRNRGGFTFKKINTKDNVLSIRVGPFANSLDIDYQPSGGYIYNTVSFVQKVSFVADFGDNNERFLTAEEVASIIRNQTYGVRVSVDRENRIILMDDSNVDPAVGSSISILEDNNVLGFKAGDKDNITIAGFPPNWNRVSMLDLFPVLGELSRYIEDTSQNFLRALEDVARSIEDYINTLIQRVDALNEIIVKLSELAQKLADILGFTGGIWYLRIPTKSGGVEYLKTSLINSTNKPRSYLAAGIMFVYGDGATEKALGSIFKQRR